MVEFIIFYYIIIENSKLRGLGPVSEHKKYLPT